MMGPPFIYLGRVGSALLIFWVILTSLGDLCMAAFFYLYCQSCRRGGSGAKVGVSLLLIRGWAYCPSFLYLSISCQDNL